MSPAVRCKFHCFVSALDKGKRRSALFVGLPKAFYSVDYARSPARDCRFNFLTIKGFFLSTCSRSQITTTDGISLTR